MCHTTISIREYIFDMNLFSIMQGNYKDTQVKVLTVGDSGVGKSLLTSILTENNGSKNQCKWTIGANTEIAMHCYRQGTADEAIYCCELWDVSGNQAHRNSRNVFYRDFHALIFVHDLTNRKSLINIAQWSDEVLGGDQESGANVPLILVGTKQNEVPMAKRNEVSERSRRMAEEIGAVHINLDSMDTKVLTPGSSVKIGMR